MRAKLPVITLWMGTAAALCLGYAYHYFEDHQPVPFFVFPLIGPVVFTVAQILARSSAKT